MTSDPTDAQFDAIIELGEQLGYSPAALDARMKLIKTSKDASEFIDKLRAEVKKQEGQGDE